MKIGFVQNNPVFGQVEKNLERIRELFPKEETDLVVLPELFATGYQFADEQEAQKLGEPVPNGPTTRLLLELARERQTTIVAGLAERAGGKVYNGSVVVDPEGLLGEYRKMHLFDTEKACFEPGDRPPPVFEVGGIPVGVIICFDWRFPETCRSLALRGAEIIAHPANLVLPHCPQAMITRCLENRVFAITADRVGEEHRISGQPLKFMGQSQVVDPDGEVIVRASEDGEESCVVEIDPAKARNKRINSNNDLFADRREDLYIFK